MKELVLVIGPALPEAARSLCTSPGYSPSGKAENETGGEQVRVEETRATVELAKKGRHRILERTASK